jgi:multidrug efflux pump subunit AcrB
MQADVDHVRPIAMTTIAAILALLPLSKFRTSKHPCESNLTRGV